MFVIRGNLYKKAQVVSVREKPIKLCGFQNISTHGHIKL